MALLFLLTFARPSWGEPVGFYVLKRSQQASARVCFGLVFGVLGLLLPGLAAERPADRLDFRGRVTLPPKILSPRTRLTLALVGVTTPFSGRTWADSSGRFRFRHLQPGSYSLSIYIPGTGEILQTVEITPSFADPKGRVEKKFVFDEQTLQAQVRAVHRGVISVRELATPAKARKEYRKAQARLRARDVEGAIEHLKRAVELAPQFIEALNNLGTIYFQRQEFSRAEGYFRKALEIEPEAFAPLVNLGGVLLAIGLAEEAFEINRKAQDARPQDALANAQLGLSYYLLGDYEEAASYLEQTKEIDPAHFTNPQISLARIYLRRAQEKEALRELEEFLEQHPDSPQAQDVKAMIEKLQRSHANSADEPPPP
ncbi:MAG: hypothetical protein A3J28_07000 [Acidobacteria bacterium RIFCSPLOWO2_12_FULL_60_22]|nr:MAG: hypothetical protein A3J28_07000 [Acidobacteria bacterium RIFCSPLOWO2_12_FULL_60_22]